MSDQSKTQAVKMLPGIVDRLDKKIDKLEEDAVGYKVFIGKMTDHMEGQTKTLEKLDAHCISEFKYLSKRIGVIEMWRNWTTGIAITIIGIIGFFRDAIVDSIKSHFR